MSRRRQKTEETIETAKAIIGLVLVGALYGFVVLVPIHGVGTLIRWLAVFPIICFLGLAIFFGIRWYRRAGRVAVVEFDLDKLSPLVARRESASKAPACSPGQWVFNEPPKTAPPKDLMDQLRAVDWFQFEKVMEHAYRALGYAVTRRGGANPDGGIDLVLEKDGTRTAVQCKQWKSWNVGVKAIREFLGALVDSGISKGIFVTIGGYTGGARAFAGKHGINILGETELLQLMERAGTRFDPVAQGILTDTRKYCPRCEHEMILRTALRGAHEGSRFWGCSTYPGCL